MSALSKLNLDDDYQEALGVEDAQRSTLDREDDLVVRVGVSPIDHPGERFTARLVWTEYPGDLPPSVLFVEPATGSSASISGPSIASDPPRQLAPDERLEHRHSRLARIEAAERREVLAAGFEELLLSADR